MDRDLCMDDGLMGGRRPKRTVTNTDTVGKKVPTALHVDFVVVCSMFVLTISDDFALH